jgi:hypothetical protein
LNDWWENTKEALDTVGLPDVLQYQQTCVTYLQISIDLMFPAVRELLSAFSSSRKRLRRAFVGSMIPCAQLTVTFIRRKKMNDMMAIGDAVLCSSRDFWLRVCHHQHIKSKEADTLISMLQFFTAITFSRDPSPTDPIVYACCSPNYSTSAASIWSADASRSSD